VRRFLAVLSGVLIALGLALAISLVLDDEPASEDGVARTDVEVTLDPGDGPSRSVTLRCDGEADDEACRVLDDLDEDVLDPVPPGRSCTSQFGGPETVTVRGTLRGETVDVRFDRTDGCEIARYERIEPLLSALDL